MQSSINLQGPNYVLKAYRNISYTFLLRYDEVCAHKYDFKRDVQPSTLHFTQLLWNASTSLGIGMATSINNGMYCTYFVAQYKPKGNIIGHFAENVKRVGTSLLSTTRFLLQSVV